MDGNDGMMAPPPNRAPKVTAAEVVVASDRPMNDTTLPKPRYTARKKKNPAVDPRSRFGLHDWKRLLQNSKDLAQRKGEPLRRDIPKEEVARHDKNHDGWIILRGRVYNIGPYLHYHPGGVNIFKSVLGKDATSLFDKYHRWVNIDGLIGPLMLGTVAAPSASQFSAVPAKEQHLTNAPRLSAQKVATESSLLKGEEDEDEEEEPIILPM